MNRPIISKGFIKKVLFTLAALFLVAGLCCLDGFFIEPYYPRIVRQAVFIDDLPKSLDGVKIIQLSDLHIVKLGKREERAIRLIDRTKPDIICLTGDYINDDGITPGKHSDSECIKEACRFVERLHSRYGVYGVRGNWDTLWINKPFENLGIHMLDDHSEMVKINGAGLLFASDCPYKSKRHTPTIVLQHIPPSDEQLSSMNGLVDLVLSGHYHGGQVCRPFRCVDDKYVAGLYRVGKINLYVTRGLGMHSEAVRFGCPSEITLITLRRK